MLLMIYFSSQSLLFYFKPLFCGDSLRLISGRSSLQLAFTVNLGKYATISAAIYSDGRCKEVGIQWQDVGELEEWDN